MQGTKPFTQLLRQAPSAQRLGQLELALRNRVSQRPVSDAESGRAMSSRPLLMHWLRELQLPLRMRNVALLRVEHLFAADEATRAVLRARGPRTS